MTFTNYRSIWKDILDNAGADLTAIKAALNSQVCFLMYLESRDWTNAEACVDDMSLTTEQKTYVKGKIPG